MSWLIGLIIVISTSVLGFFLGLISGWILIWHIKINKPIKSLEKIALSLNKFGTEFVDLKNISKEIKENNGN